MYFPTFAIGDRVRAVVNVNNGGVMIPAGTKGDFQRCDGMALAVIKWDGFGPGFVAEEEIEKVTGEEP